MEQVTRVPCSRCGDCCEMSPCSMDKESVRLIRKVGYKPKFQRWKNPNFAGTVYFYTMERERGKPCQFYKKENGTATCELALNPEICTKNFHGFCNHEGKLMAAFFKGFGKKKKDKRNFLTKISA